MTSARWQRLKSDPDDYADYKAAKKVKDVQRRLDNPALNKDACRRYYEKHGARIRAARKAKRLAARNQRASTTRENP